MQSQRPTGRLVCPGMPELHCSYVRRIFPQHSAQSHPGHVTLSAGANIQQILDATPDQQLLTCAADYH